MKVCIKCNLPKSEGEFYRRKDKRKLGRTSLSNSCKLCEGKYQQQFNKTNPHIQRRAQLKFLYSLTPEKYEILLKNQDGVCAICKQPETHHTHKHLAVDHNHATGKIRGLLCHDCNIMMGYAKENINILSEGINYLNLYNVCKIKLD